MQPSILRMSQRCVSKYLEQHPGTKYCTAGPHSCANVITFPIPQYVGVTILYSTAVVIMHENQLMIHWCYACALAWPHNKSHHLYLAHKKAPIVGRGDSESQPKPQALASSLAVITVHVYDLASHAWLMSLLLLTCVCPPQKYLRKLLVSSMKAIFCMSLRLSCLHVQRQPLQHHTG